MSRYHFNIRNGQNLLDAAGTDFTSLGEVRTEALEVAGELLRGGGGPAFWSGEDWQMSVIDEAGATVLTLTISGSEPGLHAML